MIDAYTLPDLQRYLQQYPAAHYSHGGKEPLLYAVVQLLSLQFRCGAGRQLLLPLAPPLPWCLPTPSKASPAHAAHQAHPRMYAPQNNVK